VNFLSANVASSATAFCPNVTAPQPGLFGSCPWGPGQVAFDASIGVPDSYAMTTLLVSLSVREASVGATEVVCVRATVTPQLNSSLSATLTFVPLAIVLVVGLANCVAAIWNPWTGSYNLFRAFSHNGMDPDALRLMTPGFLDVWSYIQFAVLSASLNINYPEFFQPIISRVAWANFLFKTTIACPNLLDWGTATTDFSGQLNDDPLHFINIASVYAMDGMASYLRLAGLPENCAWQTVIVWVLIITVAVLVLTESFIALVWVYGKLFGNDKVDLLGSNIPFLIGMTEQDLSNSRNVHSIVHTLIPPSHPLYCL
jgi:hypothetical protein